mmetsp:Transcript_5973/g.15188  ORF Transcript_5973/g.15188 Transcript_5973/m.15188 type:complete len:97 (+) Transcript_5973:1418-1708(+)
MLPSERSVRVSNISKILKRGWWIDSTIVRPWSASLLRRASTDDEVVASSPVVGSSRKSTGGLVTSSMPMAQRLRSPPEMPPLSWGEPTIVSAHFSR